MATVGQLTLRWDDLHKQTRREILDGACLNERYQHYEWQELETWIQQIITDNVVLRSKGTVEVG